MSQVTRNRALKAVFFGTPALASHTLLTCIDSGIAIPLVCTRPPSAAGRGKKKQASAVQQLATEMGIPTITPDRLDEDAANAIREVQPDVAIVVAYGRLIPESILNIPRKGAVNLHPSLLPKHRGPSPVQTTILNGDDHAGVTIMLLDSGMDTGPILQQSVPVEVGKAVRADELSELLFQIGGEIMPIVVKEWCADELTPILQDESRATVTKLLSKTDGMIDWNADARQILIANRAYHPWPGTYTTWNGLNLKLHSFARVTLPVPAEHTEPGTVWSHDGATLHITAGDGVAVTPTELQLAGRNSTHAADFARGRPDFIGAILGS